MKKNIVVVTSFLLLLISITIPPSSILAAFEGTILDDSIPKDELKELLKDELAREDVDFFCDAQDEFLSYKERCDELYDIIEEVEEKD
jgi:hypothetical protein